MPCKFCFLFVDVCQASRIERPLKSKTKRQKRAEDAGILRRSLRTTRAEPALVIRDSEAVVSTKQSGEFVTIVSEEETCTSVEQGRGTARYEIASFDFRSRDIWCRSHLPSVLVSPSDRARPLVLVKALLSAECGRGT